MASTAFLQRFSTTHSKSEAFIFTITSWSGRWRIICTWLLKYFKPGRMMAIFAECAASLLLIVMYIVTKELSQKHYKVVLGGFALWGVDIFNEIWNSMICFISGYAPVWGTPVGVGNSAWLLMIGYNIEISFMFLMMGITVCLMLPEDPKAKILGINNRIFFCVVLTTLAVIIECFLNWCGVLTWEWAFWQRSCPWILWLIGYLPFFATAFYVHDRPTVKQSAAIVGGILGFDAVLIVICACLGWI